MTQDPQPDPLDETQPIDPAVADIGRYAPAPEPRPDTRWAWASSPSQTPATPWASSATITGAPPAVPVASSQPPTLQAEGVSAQTSTPFDDVEMASAPPPSPVTPGPTPRRRGGPGIGTIVAASLLSAVLASTGTVLVLHETGAFTAGTASGPQASPQTNTGQPVAINESSAVIAAAASVSPAVVKLTVTAQGTDPFGTGQSEGVGSGVIYDANGWILTNKHVVNGATKITVELKDGRTFDGRIYGTDTFSDLAIVKIDATGLPAAALGKSDELKVGQLVIAIGSPLGTYSFSVTSGIVSAKGRELTEGTARITNLIQTDAAINPGNSGGPLVDAAGHVVGINTAVATDSSGIGFAIPIDIARPIMNQAVKGETLARPYIGVRYNAITLQLKTALNLPVDNGALIGTGDGTGNGVTTGSPAEKAGLKDGDILLAINGTPLDQEHPLDAMLVQHAPNEVITLDVLRAGATIKVQLTLGVRPTNLQ